MNADAIVSAIERSGFQVVRMEPKFTAGMDAVAREVDACDVLVGAHGAGLTNMVFLRTGAVVVQVIPWGKMEPYWHAFSDVLVPLFTTARAFGGEVELVATGVGAQGWFLKKFCFPF